MRFLSIVALSAALAGCAGRAPAPVAVVQPTDRYMDCTAILAEVSGNNERVKQLAADKGLKTTQNVAAGVAGLFTVVRHGFPGYGRYRNSRAAKPSAIPGDDG